MARVLHLLYVTLVGVLATSSHQLDSCPDGSCKQEGDELSILQVARTPRWCFQCMQDSLKCWAEGQCKTETEYCDTLTVTGGPTRFAQECVEHVAIKYNMTEEEYCETGSQAPLFAEHCLPVLAASASMNEIQYCETHPQKSRCAHSCVPLLAEKASITEIEYCQTGSLASVFAQDCVRRLARSEGMKQDQYCTTPEASVFAEYCLSRGVQVVTPVQEEIQEPVQNPDEEKCCTSFTTKCKACWARMTEDACSANAEECEEIAFKPCCNQCNTKKGKKDRRKKRCNDAKDEATEAGWCGVAVCP